MNQRERILAIAVGGLLAAVVLNWAFGKYKSAVKIRNNEITSLTEEQTRLNEQILQGEYANRQMGEYMVRSLPGNPEQAESDYQQWLLEWVKENGVGTVDKTSSRTIGGLYQLIDFRVQGTTDIPQFIRLLHDFYAQDYLHRIRDVSLQPNREGRFQLDMSVDAIALVSAPNELPERSDPSWRVEADVMAYSEPILNRNLFEPPNKAPRFDGRSEIEAVVGRMSPASLPFKDPEGHRMRYEFASEPPEGVRLDERSGTLRIMSDDKREFELLVRAIDSGRPSRMTEQRVRVRVLDPPPERAQAPPKLGFDDSTQTVLTALVQGRTEATAWLDVRTKAKTLKLRQGDQFEIGRLKGSVIEASPNSVTIEVEGRQFKLEPGDNLGEAAKRAQAAE
ncbi:MAG: cadherin repeat domain-containing protein [Planctomycetota bacterium]